jgi:CheY-like chemotaxis protein
MPTRRAAPPAEPAHLRVLIADDKADLADSLAALLRLDGHEVRVAYSGESALAVARTFQPHAAVLDLGMPGLDGYELCRALRAEPGGSALTLIAQTGWGLAEHRQRSREAGFDHHVVKPVDPRELIELLQQRRAQRPGQAPASAGTGSAE